MGSFPGHALPGFFFICFGLWFAMKESYRYFAKMRRPTRWYKNVDLLEGFIKVFFTSIGILMEQVTYNGPAFHLYNPSDPQEFQDGNNWAHCTMYSFFLYSGLSDLFAYKFPKLTPKGLPNIMLGLAFFVEGYLFYFHASGREGIDVRVHVLLVISTFIGGSAITLAGVVDALQSEEKMPNFSPHKQDNGYLKLETMEDSVLENNDNAEDDLNESTKIKSDSTEFNQIIALLESNKAESSNPKQYKNLKYILIMTTTISTILQGTWFWQVAFTLYPPNNKPWDKDSHTNMEFITMIYTWHLSVAILLVASIHGLMYHCLTRKRTTYNEI